MCLSNLPNIGEKLEQQLHEVGIYTKEELQKIGSKQAWLKIQAIDETACLHRLTALQGAIEGVRKSELSPLTKEDLKCFYKEHKL